MIKKYIICPDRLRRIPQHFSWLDHLLIRDGYFQRCQSEDLALYLFLVTVGDAQGLSFYSDNSLCKQLRVSSKILRKSRQTLKNIGLIAYEEPLYQVLSLDRKFLDTETIISPDTTKKPKLSGDSSKFNQRSPIGHLQPRAKESLHIGEVINQIERKFER